VITAGYRVLTFIRFSHTVFALPFALGAMMVAARGWPSWRTFLLILLAMVFARTAAMTFNRVVDWEFDKLNPRTVGRHLLVSRSVAIAILVGSACAFIFVTMFINRICFLLSPVALALVFFYSITKRFTSWSHFFLGLALAISPVGAWLAVTGSFAWESLILAGGVLLWVAGFDLIYATQDVEFDRRAGLHSMVVKLGVEKSLKLARRLHGGTVVFLTVFGFASKLGFAYFAAVWLMFAVLIYEHRVTSALDVQAINKAFFECNAAVGLLFVGGIVLDFL
jgi:4-hydroxybenzoate polyprenyltransferase